MIYNLDLNHEEMNWFTKSRKPGPLVKDQFPKVMELYIGIEVQEFEPRTENLIINEGSFSKSQLEDFTKILCAITEASKIYSFYDGLALLKSSQESEEVPGLFYSSLLSEIPIIYSLDDTGFCPSWYWPEDRSWFVEHDIDIPVAIVGGSKHFISSLTKVLPVDFRVLKGEDKVPR